MKKAKTEWKLSKLVKLASKEGEIGHGEAMRLLHLLSGEMTELAEEAVSKGLIRVIQKRGTTKHSTIYKATGKEFEPEEFIDVTGEYLAKHKLNLYLSIVRKTRTDEE